MKLFPQKILSLLHSVIGVVTLVLCSLLVQASNTQGKLELTTNNLSQIIDPIMNKWIDACHGPGAVVVVVDQKGTLFANAYGFADIAAKKRFKIDSTLVRPGSISKLFTGIAVMQLVDAGKLDLDIDVNAYLDFKIPESPGGVPVTLRRLLMHRAGFEHYAKTDSNGPFPEALSHWLSRFKSRRIFPKGDVWSYSNYGFVLAGYIVERQSGEPFAAYIKNHILDPMGMTNSTFEQPLPHRLLPLLPKCYQRSDKPPLTFVFRTWAPIPAGALTSTGEDMGRFMRALLNGGTLGDKCILSRKRLHEMMEPREATPAGYQGLVFRCMKIANHDVIGHDGSMAPFVSDLSLFPQQGIGVFTSMDGTGDIKGMSDFPRPALAIAEHFLPEDEKPVAQLKLAPESELSGNWYMGSTESSFIKLDDLLEQSVLRIQPDGNATAGPAILPFFEGIKLRHIAPRVYEIPLAKLLCTFKGSNPSNFRAIVGQMEFRRVPWDQDVRLILPLVIASSVVSVLTLLCWPVATLRRQRMALQAPHGTHFYATTRVVLLIDVIVILFVLAFYTYHSQPLPINDSLDPYILLTYVLAWIGTVGAGVPLWSVVRFPRHSIGLNWTYVHNLLIASSSIVLAWFFITYHVAGTTLNF